MHKTKRLGERFSKRKLERRETKMEARKLTVEEKIDRLGTFTVREHRKAVKTAKLLIYIAAAQLVGLIALAGRALGAW